MNQIDVVVFSDFHTHRNSDEGAFAHFGDFLVIDLHIGDHGLHVGGIPPNMKMIPHVKPAVIHMDRRHVQSVIVMGYGSDFLFPMFAVFHDMYLP